MEQINRPEQYDRPGGRPVPYRDEETGMPIGFAMALARDTNAMYNFGQLSFPAQDILLSRARQASSRAEMQRIVSELNEHGVDAAGQNRDGDVFNQSNGVFNQNGDVYN